MYVCTLEEFILVDLDTLLYKLELLYCTRNWSELNSIGNAVAYIQSQQWMRNVRIALRSQLTCED